MPPLQNSLSITGLARIGSRLAHYGRCSVVGRVLSGLTVAVGRWASASATFRTTSIESLPLDAPTESTIVGILGKGYVRLRSARPVASLGRASVRWHHWAGHSLLVAGEWTRLVGASLLGMACGLAVRSVFSVSATLAVFGALLLAWGPLLYASLGHSVTFRRFQSRPSSAAVIIRERGEARRPTVFLAVAGAIFFLSGLVSGLVNDLGPAWLAGGAICLALATAVVRRVEVMLLIAAAFPWVDVLARAASGSAGIWDEAFLFLAFILMLWGVVVSGRLQLRTVPVTLPALFVLLAAIGSMVVRKVPTDVGLNGTRVLLEPLLFYFMGFLLLSSTRWLRAVVGVFLTSTTALALHGIYQFVTHVPTPKEWLDPAETGIVTRAFSVVGKPNELGAVLALAILVTLAIILIRGTRTRTRLGLGVLAAIHVVALGMTFSRSAMLGALFGLLAMLLLAYRRYLMPTLGLGVLGVLVAPRSLWDRFSLVFSSGYLQRAAVDGRTYRWFLALDQIGAHPLFGVGIGTFGATSATNFGYWDKWIDNTYLQMGAEGGLLLLAAFLWLLLRTAKGLVKGYRTATDPLVRALNAGVFGAMVSIGITNIFLNSLEKLPVSVGLWLLAGIATSAAMDRGAQPTR